MSVTDGHMPEFAKWYEAAMRKADVRFSPLAQELERLLEVKTTVDQTGGMVMCLRVPIGRDLDKFGYSVRWAWFSELGHMDDIGVGLYEALSEDEMPEGEYHQWPGEFHCGESWENCAWYHHGDLAREVARWAAPLIVEFAARTQP